MEYRIGLEIAEDTLRLAVVTKLKTGWRLENVFMVEALTGNITSSLRLGRGVFCLPGRRVLMKELDLDIDGGKDEIYQYLRQQSCTLLGRPTEHWGFDFEVTQENQVRVAAAPREDIETWLRVCHAGGLRVCAVDVDVLALARLMSALTGYQPEQPQALLWLKSAELIFIVAQAGKLIYAKRTTYHAEQRVEKILTPLLRFFHGIYPQHSPTLLFSLNDLEMTVIGNLPIKTAELNPAIWQLSATMQPDFFCSLGLALYEH